MALNEPDTSLVGKLLDDRYEILEVLGEGGVGTVYRARRVQLGRVVAIKVLHESLVEKAGFVARFEREAVAMSRLYHPHCVAVIDFGVYQSRPYLVLEYLPGWTVTQLLQEGPFGAQRAVHVVLQLLETLQHFHSHHVIHRDLKSENVMLIESSGTTDFVKVLDFGMAKILEGPGADSQLSVLGILPGTPSAMAPEQIRQLPPDPRIDIYSTGILLYEMIVGSRPFRDSDIPTILKMQLSEVPKLPRDIVGEQALSPELERVIMKALEKNRLERYGTAREMADAIRDTPEARALSSPGIEALDAGASRASRSWKWWLAAAIAGALALGAFAASELAPLLAPPEPLNTVRAERAPPSPRPPAMPAPPPERVIRPWLVHRDLAVTYSQQGKHDAAFREVQAAVAADPEAATADAPLLGAAVDALDNERIEFVTESFGSNPALADALVEATTSETPELRSAAFQALGELDQQSRVDMVAMHILDLEQANKCRTMRRLFRRLRKSDDPRVGELATELRKRERRDPHRRCLRRFLRRR